MDGGRSRRARGVYAALVLVVLAVAAALSGSSRAGSNFGPTVDITVSPHVLTAGNSAYMVVKFTNPGPSTVNHVSATVQQKLANGSFGPLPLAADSFFNLPSGCQAQAAVPTGSTVTCDIGQVAPGLVRRVLQFTPPAATPSFFAGVQASFDEAKGTQLTDTVPGADEVAFRIAGSGEAGKCTATGNTLTAEDGIQRTFLGYSTETLGWNPCTPANAGVDGKSKPIGAPKAFGEISFTEFLSSGPADLATVKVYFLTTPQGITKKNIALYELANYPIDLSVTADGSGNITIPKCVLRDGILQIPSGSVFHSCLVGADNLPGGGIVAELRALGGSDPGFGGTG